MTKVVTKQTTPVPVQESGEYLLSPEMMQYRESSSEALKKKPSLSYVQKLISKQYAKRDLIVIHEIFTRPEF